MVGAGAGETCRSRYFQTTLPAGQYCDVYNGRLENGNCTGKIINVGSNGIAHIVIDSKAAVAISLASKIGPPLPPEPEPTQKPIDPKELTKTVIFLKRDTSLGENIFLRGGNSHAHGGGIKRKVPACAEGPYQQPYDKCAIPMLHQTRVPYNYFEYKSWSQGDSYLDFEGPEIDQGLLSYIQV
ncbi:unnamed protein product [Strongylus vulgaris]|uniref:Alpha-amylase C-terminal domain-containing protein n=1 Tax=Strongylus vulgaris TaxID=40348 RepID=A0A3P7IRE6_STRVU|nr:unnamed protein product [Strongylus vulgaris]